MTTTTTTTIKTTTTTTTTTTRREDTPAHPDTRGTRETPGPLPWRETSPDRAVTYGPHTLWATTTATHTRTIATRTATDLRTHATRLTVATGLLSIPGTPLGDWGAVATSIAVITLHAAAWAAESWWLTAPHVERGPWGIPIRLPHTHDTDGEHPTRQ